MATVEQLIAALQELPQEQEIFYVYWSRTDIDELLKEREEQISNDEEWAKWVNRMNSDEPLAHQIWEAAHEYIVRLVGEREVNDSE